MSKQITTIKTFERLGQSGKETTYECCLTCGCREQAVYLEGLVPHGGGWAECSCGIVDAEARAFGAAAQSALKRILHNNADPMAQVALSALLYAYRFERNQKRMGYRTRPNRHLPPLPAQGDKTMTPHHASPETDTQEQP